MNIFQLQEALVKTTKILAGKNLPVHMEGFAPRVEFDGKTKMPTRIFIPAIPEGASPRLVDAIQGYIDHECSHIALSDAEDICDKSKSKLWHYVHNCIEDPRVNKGMGEIYPGSKQNIKRGYEYIFTELKDPESGLSPYSKEFIETHDFSDPKVKAKFHLQYASLWFAGKMGCSISRDKFLELHLDNFYEDLMDKADPEMIKSLGEIKTAEDVRKLSDYWEGFFNEEVLEEMKPDKGDGDKMEGVGEAAEDAMKTLEEQLAEAIEKEVKKKVIESKQQIYWTDRFDKKFSKQDITKQIETRGGGRLSVSEFEEKTKQVTNFLQKDLRRMLEERNRRYYIGGYKSGKLNSKSLFSVRCGNDRVFKKKNDVREVNAAVSLLVDMSGSMGGSKIHVAMQSAYAFAMTLTQLKVPFEIYGFVTEEVSSAMSSAYHKWAADQSREVQARVINSASPERFYAFKEFDEAFDIVTKKAMSGTGQGSVPMMQNEDSKHVLLALQRLSVRPEKVKALFVFSDGHPCFHGNTHLSEEQLRYLGDKAKSNYGVDIYSIGIQSDAVRRFYKQFKVINEVSNLPTALFEFLRKIF